MSIPVGDSISPVDQARNDRRRLRFLAMVTSLAIGALIISSLASTASSAPPVGPAYRIAYSVVEADQANSEIYVAEPGGVPPLSWTVEPYATTAWSSCHLLSNSTGDSCPHAECRRRGL